MVSDDALSKAYLKSVDHQIIAFSVVTNCSLVLCSDHTHERRGSGVTQSRDESIEDILSQFRCVICLQDVGRANMCEIQCCM